MTRVGELQQLPKRMPEKEQKFDGEIRIRLWATFKTGMPIKHPCGNAKNSIGFINSGTQRQARLTCKSGNLWHLDTCDPLGLDEVPHRRY